MEQALENLIRQVDDHASALVNEARANYSSPYSAGVVVLQMLFASLLLLATHYRRELSSNDSYRQRIRSRRSTSASREGKSLSIHRLQSRFSNLEECLPSGDVMIDEIFGKEDILINIVEFLGMGDVEHLFCASCTIHDLLSSETVWKKFFLVRHGYLWENSTVLTIMRNRGITFDPHDLTCDAPDQGWRNFMVDFEYAYVDWLLAGHNRPEACFVHIEKAIMDVSLFLSGHPGSPETLCEHAGMDATDVFIDIGHSRLTESLRSELMVTHTKGSDFSRRYRPYEAGDTLVLPSRVATLRKHRRVIMSGVVGADCFVSKETSSRKFVNARSSNPAFDLCVAEGRCPYAVGGGGGGGGGGEDSSHQGSVRPFYDPLRQEWYGWWTCCGACAHNPDGPPVYVSVASRLRTKALELLSPNSV